MANQLRTLLIGAILIQLEAMSAAGAEIRTYRFVPDGSLPYYASCGECGPPLAGARADIEGTFTVALDTQQGIGEIVVLDSKFASFFDVLWSDGEPVLQPVEIDDLPFVNTGIIPSWTHYEFPFEGTLTDNGSALILGSDGARQTPNGVIHGLIPPYKILMEGRVATLNMIVPISDYYITVTSALATQVVPELNSLWLIAFAVPYLACWRILPLCRRM